MSILAPARAAASRRNGAKSKGPKTPEGKARSARNALKHGLRAQKFVVVGDEDPQAFAALEAALLDELAPEGALQSALAGRIARAAWRLERAENIEADLFESRDAKLGLAVIRDGNRTRAFETLLRYRGSATAELWRGLRLLKALQAEAAHAAESPIEPETRSDPGPAGPAPAATPAPPAAAPIKPEARANPLQCAPPLQLHAAPGGVPEPEPARRLSRMPDRR